MTRTVDIFCPGKGFPAVSTTGRSCALGCKHCGGRYLEGMVPATAPEELLRFAQGLSDRGGKGFLLSGGCDRSGRVLLDGFVPAIKEIKSTTPLRINAHIGLSRRDEVERLFDAGVDMFSVDVYGDDATVREVQGLEAAADDYISVLRHLTDLDAPVAPHICIGVMGGVLRGERSALGLLEPLSPSTIVLISLIPTRGTPFASVRPPTGHDVVSVIADARSSFPRARLLLGCMRSKRDRSWEYDAVMAGLDGIVLPSAGLKARLEASGVRTAEKDVCCALG